MSSNALHSTGELQRNWLPCKSCQQRKRNLWNDKVSIPICDRRIQWWWKNLQKTKIRPNHKLPKMSGGDYWWGRGDLNPGPRAPRARILDHARPRPQLSGLQPLLLGAEILTLYFSLKTLARQRAQSKDTLTGGHIRRLITAHCWKLAFSEKLQAPKKWRYLKANLFHHLVTVLNFPLFF